MLKALRENVLHSNTWSSELRIQGQILKKQKSPARLVVLEALVRDGAAGLPPYIPSMQSNFPPSARALLVELLVCSMLLVPLLCLPLRRACLGQASSSLLSKMEKKSIPWPKPHRKFLRVWKHVAGCLRPAKHRGSTSPSWPGAALGAGL